MKLARWWPAPLLLLLATAATYADDRPWWSFELMAGTFHSDLDDWGTFYDDNRMTDFGAGLGFKPLRQLDVGVEIGYRGDRGRGLAPGHGLVTGSVRYRLLPVHVTATLRGVFHEEQWLVPYVGVGAGRYHYRVEIDGQDDVSGHASGTHVRAGLQLWLDPFDRRAASNLKRQFGIDNSWLFVEARESRAEIAGSELGGRSYMGGLLVEF